VIIHYFDFMGIAIALAEANERLRPLRRIPPASVALFRVPLRQGSWLAQVDASLRCGRDTSIDPFPDDPTLKLRHGHQHAKLEPSSRVVIAGVYPLAAA
jgi:hypothetical protein